MDRKYKVLIVNDHPDQSVTLGVFLLTQGFEVGLPASGFEMAKEILANNLPDVVLIETNINNNKLESNLLADFIDVQYHLPIIFINQNDQVPFIFTPVANHCFIPPPAINSHYNAHILVAIDNFLKPAIIQKVITQLIEVKIIKIPILKNKEPKYLKYNNANFTKIYIDLFNIAIMQANNKAHKNSSLLWEHGNDEFCFLECISLKKLFIRHKEASIYRINRQELINENMIESYVPHHNINIEGRVLKIGKKFKKIIDATLLSIPRLNYGNTRTEKTK